MGSKHEGQILICMKSWVRNPAEMRERGGVGRDREELERKRERLRNRNKLGVLEQKDVRWGKK